MASRGPSPPPPAARRRRVPAAGVTATTVALAFLGGLILNLMPCVFPILAMKAAAIARLGAATRGRVRAEAGGYVLGVLTTFATLGLALVGLREAGSAIGWGFQFQSPLFVAAMALLLFTVGLNLSGVFAVTLPAGGHLGSGLAGSFLTGVLAVVVATPCTAPFMGAALAAGLAAPWPQTLAIFLVLGLGLAVPPLLLALAPGLARALPRPGLWMEALRQALAFPIYAAALWLAWVLTRQAGETGLLTLGAAILAIAVAAWAWGWSQRHGGRWGRILAGAGAAAALLILTTVRPPSPLATGAETFTPQRLAALRAEGRPVFVNMTAAWCVTCLINERVTFETARVREAFTLRGVTLLTGDWTRPDPVITAFLRAHGRDGVPLYLYYPPGTGAPVQLPQILTPGTLLTAIGA